MILKPDSDLIATSATAKPMPDKSAISAALEILFNKEDVVELRAIWRGGKKRIDAGFFDGDHRDQLAEKAVWLNSQGAAVYITLNPVDPQLLGRYSNRVETYAGATSTDMQVQRRRWLLIDLDPVRPTDTSATAVQVEAARRKSLDVIAFLHSLGWPMPVVSESGNGYHLLYGIDLPNDDPSKILIQGTLKALAERFDDAQTKVDKTVFNAARICKLYGTVANKGDHTVGMPWRLSKIVHRPKRSEVTVEQLAAMLPETPAQAQQLSVPHHHAVLQTYDSFKLEDFLQRHALAFEVDRHDGKERFKLETCPFNQTHVKGEAAVFRDPSGKLGFKCQHNSCSSKSWRDVREQLDGPRLARPASISTSAPTPIQASSGVVPLEVQWPDPTPLPDELPPVAPFEAELLPETLRGWVLDIAHRMQCPPDFPAVTAIVGISSLIGPRALVQPKVMDEWKVTPNLWGVVVGRPGVKKSPALSEALKPLSRLQSTAFESLKVARAAWEIDSKLAVMQADANAKKAKSLAEKDPFAARALLVPRETSPEPVARRFIVNDATVEKLGEILQQNPWGTLAYRDEVYSLLTSLDKQGQEDARGFYLQGYDGDKSYTVDRIGRGTVHIPRLCLSMIGGIQPGRIQEYVRDAVAGGSADDGLLQRFGLAVWPDVAGSYIHVDKRPDIDSRQAAWSVFDRLSKLETHINGEPVVWHFDDAAQALFVEWLIAFENEIRGDSLHPAMVSHLAKYRKLIPALALVFALIDTPENDGVIGERELARALAWGKYLRSHASRLYAAAVIPETTDSATLLSKIKAGKLKDSDGKAMEAFTPRLVALKHWSGLSTPTAVRKAADLLVDYGWLRKEIIGPSAAGGRPSERYCIHTDLLKSTCR